MSDLAFRGTFEDRISPALKKVEGNVQKLNNKFAGLKGALAGLAIGAAIRNVINLADGIQDVSDATGMAVQNVLGFQQAVQLNGGTAEQATQSIQKLVQTVGEAANGSKKAQDAFSQVGVTLNDLATLSEQDLLAKTVQGLAGITDASQRAVLTTDLLGKSFRGINLQGVSSQLASATASSYSMAKAVQQTAEMQGKLDIATQKLQMSLLKAIQPLVEFINKMDDEKIGKMIDTIVDLGSKLAALTVAIYALDKAFTAIQKIIVFAGAAFVSFKLGAAAAASGLVLLMTNLKTVGNILKNIAMLIVIPFTTFGGVLTRISTIILALIGSAGKLGAAFLAIGLGLVRMIPYIGAVVTGFLALNEAVKFFSDKSIVEWFSAGIDKMKEFLGIQQKISKDLKGPDQSEAETKRLQRLNDTLAQQTTKVREVTDALAQKRKEIQQASQAYKDQNDEILDSIVFEKSLIGKSEDLQQVMRAQEDVFKRAADESKKLQDAKSKLGKDEQSLAIIYDQQIAKIQEVANKDAQRIGNAIVGLQGVKMLEEDRLRTMQNVTAAIEAQISRQQQLGDLMVSANDKLKDVQFAGAQQQRSPLEQQLAAIQEEARKAALEAGRAFASSYEGMDLTSAQSQELADGLQQIAEKYKLIATEQTNQLNASRTWDQGWKTAFDNYMDNATNAAQQAGQVFGNITNRMNSAIDNFVETGKFSFKDFTRSIIQDLIKIELKAQATKLLGAIGGSGGILSSIGSLFGFANGGTPPLNKPSIVGEQGPELFVPRSAGTVIPNDKLGGGGNQISAPVTNNYITNNISAMDAKSVAQLFAENRKTLLGTVEMARKELPYSNR